MPIIIREIVSEVVLDAAAADGAGPGAGLARTANADASSAIDVEKIVALASERVLEVLRREWDR